MAGQPNVIFISIHINTVVNGSQWINATGWSCYTCKGQIKSDKLQYPVSIVRLKNNFHIFVRSMGFGLLTLHICESVFRKSSTENVVVF